MLPRTTARAAKCLHFIASQLLILSILSGSMAWQIVPNRTLPSYLSQGCAAALSQEVSTSVCNPMANRLLKGYFYAESTLNRTCTDGCADFLAQYESSVVSSCRDEEWQDYFNAAEKDSEPEAVQVRVIPNLLRHLFALTCLRDSGRFCNVVIGNAAMAADPGSTHFGWAPPPGSGADIPSSCDLCFVKRLRMEAGSPYYEGPRLSSMSLYQSLTSSCGVADMPLTTSTLDFPTPTGAQPTPTCAGSTYAVQAGDTCLSISQSQSIGTGWLVDDNNLGAWCSDFPAPGTSLCIANKCQVYTLQPNETSCAAIARRSNITEAQLKAWNPIIDLGCYNLPKMNGTALCVSAPGRQYVPPANATITGSPGTGATPVPVPGDVAEGTTTRCARYHYVLPDEYCNLLSLKYGISIPDFITLNPAVNENCTNLFAKESYCVQPVGDINTYPGRPGHSSTRTGTATVDPGPSTAFTLLPDSTMVPYERNDTRSPLADGTRDDCAHYLEGAWFTNVTSGGSLGSVCALAASNYFAELEALGLWNPSLGNTSDPGCRFEVGKRYCAQLYWDANGAQPVPDGPLYEYELREGYIKGCTRFSDVPLGWECSDIYDYYGITKEQFYQYNPAVGSDCNNLWPNYAYCTSTNPNPDEGGGGGDTTTISSTTTTTTGPGSTPTKAPGQTQDGQAANCNKWEMAQSGDSCWAIADRTGIPLTDLYAWNTVLGADGAACGTMIWPEYWYCVGVSAGVPAPTTTTTTTSPTTTSTSARPTPTGAPGQTQGGQAANCNKWVMAQAGDGCWAIADRSGIQLADFYLWNTVLGKDGSECGTMIWPEYWYCVGVSPSR
ncbi:hypothetical protein RB598_005716 [Gaeumannomyces tritici]